MNPNWQHRNTMGKHTYTYSEERLTDNFKDNFMYRTWSKGRMPHVWIGDQCHGIPDGLAFYLDPKVAMDGDVLEALEFFTNKEGFGHVMRKREQFVIVEDLILAERPEGEMAFHDADGWSRILHLGSEAREKLVLVEKVTS